MKLKKLLIAVIALVALAVTVPFVIKRTTAGTTVSVYSLPYVTQTTPFSAVTSSSGILSQTVVFPAAPQVGDAIVCYEGDTSSNNGIAPTGFTQFATTATTTSTVSISAWYHIESSTDGNNPLTFSINGTTNWFVGCSDWHGVNPNQPIETTVATGFSASNNTVILAGLTPNEAGAIPVEVGAQAASTISMTDPTLSNNLWTQQGSGISGEALDSTTPWYPFTNTFTAAPSFSNVADSVAISFFVRPLIGSFNLNGTHVAAATPTPNGTSAPSPTPPPIINTAVGHIQTWAVVGPSTVFNQNQNLTATQANNWDTYLEGYYNSSNQSVIQLCSNACTPVLYYDAENMEVNSSGHDTSFPWRDGDGNYGSSTCPEPASNLFASTKPDESWFIHATGTSSTAAERIGSAGVSGGAIDEYQWPMNPGSATAQNYIAGVTANCFVSATGYNWSPSNFGAIFEDNILFLPSNNFSTWGAFGYTLQKNVGTETNGLATNAYISGGCSNLYNGTYCTSGSQISATQTSALEDPNDTTYKNNLITMMSKIKHNATDGGGQIPIFINGQQNTDMTLISSSPVAGGVVEHYAVQNGVVQNSTMFAMIMDVCHTMAAQTPTKRFVIWDTSPGTGTYAEGNANHQLDQREHFALDWLCMYDNLVDAPYLATAVGTSAGVWPMDFIVPKNPIQTPGAATFTTTNGALGCSENYHTYFGTNTPCTGGGPRDPGICVSGTAPNCVYRREFSHCYINTAYTNVQGTDLGPCGVLMNWSGATVNPSLSGSGWLTNWALYTRIILPCVPTASYFSSGVYGTGTTTVCNGTSGSDVANGGQADISTNRDALTSLPNGDSVFYVANNTSGGGGGTSGNPISIQQSCTGSTTCTFTSAPVNGDYMVAIGFNGIDAFSCNSGWTLIQHVSATLDDGISCYRKASSEGTTVTPFSGTAANIESEVWDVANVDSTTPIDANAGSESGATSSNTVTLTTSVAGDLLIGGGAQNQLATMNTPTNFTNDFAAAPCAATGFSCTFDHQLNVASGSQSATFTSTGGVAKQLTALLVALKPATPGGGGGGSTSTPPPSGNVATYDGCTIFKAGDPYNKDITSAAIDANSAAMISALPNDTLDGAGGYEAINTATSSTPLYTVSANDGHNPPFNNTNPTYTQEPWSFASPDFFIGTTVDNHAMVLRTSDCKDFETYKATQNTSTDTLTAYSGHVWDFTVAYAQPPIVTYSSMASGLPLLAGGVKWNGELGAATPTLNHALNFAWPTGQGVSQYGFLYPAGGWTGLACTGTCTHPMHYGEHLRLHASVTCPTNAQAAAVCNALKHYGMFYADQGSPSLYLIDADNAGTTSPFSSAVESWLVTVHITDFDVLAEPTLQCAPGHTGCL